MKDNELQKSAAFWVCLAMAVGAFTKETFIGAEYGNAFWYVVGIGIGGAFGWTVVGAALDRLKSTKEDREKDKNDK